MNKNYEIFSKYIPNLKNISQQNVICWFKDHEDTQASMSINLDKGTYKCFGCNAWGDIYSITMYFEHCSFREAKMKILGDARVAVLSEAEVQEAHKYLISKKYLCDMLFQHRRWMMDTILKFKLGYNEREKRVQIPIYDELGKLKNIRKYLVAGHVTAQNPKFRGIRGHNENYFFPIKNLITDDPKLSKFILLLAGEPDTLLACQLGYNAGTFTAGEGSFNRELLPHFKDKLVYICYDKDLAGLRALKAIIPDMAKYAKQIKIIDLPFGN